MAVAVFLLRLSSQDRATLVSPRITRNDTLELQTWVRAAVVVGLCRDGGIYEKVLLPHVAVTPASWLPISALTKPRCWEHGAPLGPTPCLHTVTPLCLNGAVNKMERAEKFTAFGAVVLCVQSVCWNQILSSNQGSENCEKRGGSGC